MDALHYQTPQYSLKKILAIWAVSTVPMAILAWIATPLIISILNIDAAIVYWAMMIIGMMWQCGVAILMAWKETGSMQWSSLRKRMWYGKPIDPRTGKARIQLFWWVIPFLLLSGLLQILQPFAETITGILPFIDNLPRYDFNVLITPDYKGAWWLIILMLLHILFNYFLGEEFLYRGILLPRMQGVFGKWDWFANGVLFGFYHLHKPEIILQTALFYGFIFSYAARRFQCNWMAVIIHGMEGIFILFLIPAIVFGWV